MFHAIVFCLCSWRLAGVFGTEYVSVMEGDPVTLKIDFTRIQSDDQIMVRFGLEYAVIAAMKRVTNQIRLIHDSVNERFRDRLKLDEKTGSLIITNTSNTDSGSYKVTTKNSVTQLNIFNITVYAPLPVPNIIVDSSQCSSSSSSSSNCSLVCSSVLNVSHATLSWYAGMSVLSSINASDLSISLSLPLDVEYQDNNTYSCVINNPVRNQTTHLDITQLCQPCADKHRHYLYIVLMSVVAATLLIVAGFGIFWICRKHRKTNQEAQTRGEDITYADPTFYKRKAHKSIVKEEDEVVYAGVAVRR